MEHEANRPAAETVADYPAAHSMDTIWYGVDENGEIGEFDSGENGYVPAPQGIAEATLNTPEALVVNEEYGNLFRFHDPIHVTDAHLPDFDELEKDEKNFHYWDRDDILLKLPRRYHFYGAPWFGGYYYWVASPTRPMNVRDLPPGVRDRIDLVYLHDYTFKSRDPINPFDYRPNCYGEYPCQVFPENKLTSFPIPSRRNCWQPADMLRIERDDDDASYFFGVDDEDCVALFRTDGFGAIPRPQWRPRSEYQTDWGVRLWKDMTTGGARAAAYPNSVAPQFRPASANEEWPNDWAERAGWIRHWLEYPFAPGTPRIYGLFHYDMSWFHAGPYERIGAPELPVRFGEFSPEWREKMNPAQFKGVRFTSSERIQPFEHLDCLPGDLIVRGSDLPVGYNAYSALPRRNQSDVWIDPALESVRPSSEDALMPDDEDRLLRRARRYYEMIRGLSRP